MELKVFLFNIGFDLLVIFVVLFVGFKFFGFLGLIIGLVILVLFNILYKVNVFYDLWKYIKGLFLK